MNKQALIEQIKKDGYKEVRICPVNTKGTYSEPHTHDQSTVHIMVKGTLTIKDGNQIKIIHTGERFDIPKETTHTIKTRSKGCKFIVGVKEN